MSAPNVSVIIPAYNCEALLGEAVESVRRQSYQDFEVLVVDDGSTDGTAEAGEAIAAGWDKLRVIRAPHAGAAAARNRGIAAARGEWIAFLDADDLWRPEKLERCLAFLADNPDLSAVYTPMATEDMGGQAMPGHSKCCRAGRITQELFESIFVHTPATVLHRRVFEACGVFDESLPVGEDHDLWLRISTKFAFGLIEEPLAVRRWSAKSLSRANRAPGRAVKAAMLERFYFEKGGRELLDRRRAMRRLGRVNYVAGKILLAQGSPRQALAHLGKSIRYRPGYLRAYPYWAAAWLACAARRDR
jgi:glycosyltransferase involved in cell wall biosynthesis